MEALLESPIGLTEDGKQYELDGVRFDRVTDILHKVLPPYLAPWAEGVGIRAAHTVAEKFGSLPDTWEQTQEEARQLGIDHEGQRDAGANRGLEAHLALEAWIKMGQPPSLEDFEPEHRPYARSLCEFLVNCEPEFECAEVTVWHKDLAYAGTIDAIGKLTKKPKGARWPDITGKRFAFDLKSNQARRIYSPQHYMQLAAYRHALDHHDIQVDGEAVIAIGPSPWESGKPYTLGVNYIPGYLWVPIVLAFRALEKARELNPRSRKKEKV